MLQKGVGWMTRRSNGPKRSFMGLDGLGPWLCAAEPLVVGPVRPVGPVVPVVPVRPIVPQGMEHVAPADPSLFVGLGRRPVQRTALVHPFARPLDALRKADLWVGRRSLDRGRADDGSGDDNASGSLLENAEPG